MSLSAIVSGCKFNVFGRGVNQQWHLHGIARTIVPTEQLVPALPIVSQGELKQWRGEPVNRQTAE
jgi:hypothetical protein